MKIQRIVNFGGRLPMVSITTETHQGTFSANGTTPAKVLVVDDESNIVELLSVSLKFQGFDVYTADSGPPP